MVDYDHAISAHLCLLFFAIYWTYSNNRLECWIRDKVRRKDEKYGNGRTIGLKFHSGAMWVDLWNDPMEHRSTDPKWWSFCFDPVDFLFGRTTYKSVNLETKRAVVPMPEGGYPCTVKINEDTWRRKRWPGVWKRMIRSEVIPDTPIPKPGKGENSWDCGEDALYSLYGTYDTALAAVMATSESVMNDRLRYGGGWATKQRKNCTREPHR